MMTPLLGFLPDVDATMPGAVVDCENAVPTARGMAGAPTAVPMGSAPALDSDCRGSAIITKLDGTRRILASTSTELLELSGSSWEVRATVAAIGAEERWSFAQFGDSTLASNLSTTIQRSTSTTFSAVATAPKAKCLVTASGFVLAFNTDAGADVWHCSAYLDDTNWTPDLSTQCTTGRLISTPGEITAARSFGDQVVVYKDKAMYLGRYVGSPAVWNFEPIPADLGCVGQDAVADIGGSGHIFVSKTDIHAFDGTRPISIADGKVREWFARNRSTANAFNTQVLHDKQNDLVWVFFPSNEATTPDSALVYMLGNAKWGHVNISIEAAMNYISEGATIDSLSGTIDSQPDIPFDSQYWLSGGQLMAVFTGTDHQLSAMSGNPDTSSITLFEVGDDAAVTKLSRVRVGYQSEPTSATVAGMTRMSRGGTLSPAGSGSYTAGKFDIRQTGRFHRVTVENVGPWAAGAVDFDLIPAGKR